MNYIFQRGLDKVLNPEHEYIIVDYDDLLPITEFTNINALNDFLQYCEDNNIKKETIEILSQTAFENFCDETDKKSFIKLFEDETFYIVDFDEVTRKWNHPDINSDYDKGLALYTSGYYPLPFDINPRLVNKMEDWIRWECLWEAAESDGWQVATAKHKNGSHDYLVNVW